MARDEDPSDSHFDLDDVDWDDQDLDEQDGGTEECPYCGEEIYEGVGQCPHCRRYITEEGDDEDGTPSRRGRRRVPWWVMVGAALALLSTLVLLLF